MTFSSDPKVLNSAIADALTETPVDISTVAPFNGEVSLPGGFITQEGLLVKYAEVRELNGSDEEAIARSTSLGKALNTILQRGLVSLGGEKVSKDDLDELLSADRDAILLGIRRATFGDVAEYRLLCPGCNTESVVGIHLDTDIPVVELGNPVEDRMWEVELKSGKAVVTFPKGTTQKALMEVSTKTLAELNTILLEGCVLSVNGKASAGMPTVLKLGMGDREIIIAEKTCQRK